MGWRRWVECELRSLGRSVYENITDSARGRERLKYRMDQKLSIMFEMLSPDQLSKPGLHTCEKCKDNGILYLYQPRTFSCSDGWISVSIADSIREEMQITTRIICCPYCGVELIQRVQP